MTTFLAALLLTMPPKLNVFIGTYTSENGSRGIYSAEFDTATGELSEPKLAAELQNPSFLALSPAGKQLYAAQEVGDGAVSAYAVSGAELKFINRERAHGSGPCHVSTDGKTVYVASYNDGGLACLPIRDDGGLGPAKFAMKNEGSGPVKGRQDGPHLHWIAADPSGTDVYAIDLGTDEVLIFRKPGEKLASAKVPAGAGPRHAAFGRDGRFLYVNNELVPGVTVFRRDGDSLAAVQTISTLPNGEANPRYSTAEIEMHPNGRWLYVSNRGHDTLAVFEVKEDGTLTRTGVEPAGVREPRSFAIDPTGRWIISAGQNSDELTVLELDGKGLPKATGKRVRAPKPVCVVFGGGR